MNHDDLDRLEDAVRTANPIPHPADLAGSEQAGRVLMLVRAQTQTEPGRPASPADLVEKTRPAPIEPSPASPRWWLKPAVVFITAAIVTLGIIGIVSLVQSSQPNVADEPTDGLPSVPWNVSANVYDVVVGRDGSLWASVGQGAARWAADSDRSFVYTDQDCPFDWACRLAVGPDGSIWLGLARFDGHWRSFAEETVQSGLFAVISGLVTPESPIAIGPDGNLWTSFGERQLARFDGSDWRVFEAPPSMQVVDTGHAWSASIDVAVDGTVWIGTSGGRGILTFDGTDWFHHMSANGLPFDSGWNVAIAPDGSIWAGSGGAFDDPGTGGIVRFDGSTWTTFTTSDGLQSNDAEVAVGPDGTVWAMHPGGVSRFDGSVWIAYPDSPGFGSRGAVDASGTLWMPDETGIVGFDGSNVTRLDVPVDDPPVSPMAPLGEWDPLLATTRAKQSPPAATCPAGSDPSTPGPAEQERPHPGDGAGLEGVFDTHRGHIIYLDGIGRTWAFDVCTNTWAHLNPDGPAVGELSAGLVYDVDSDVTVALGYESVSVYDANANEWAKADTGPVGLGEGSITPRGAAYDSVSGLILTNSQDRIWAYDVDTNAWTAIGKLPSDSGLSWNDFLGYSADLDRLIFGSDSAATVLVDPRNGEATLVRTETPVIGLGWQNYGYGPAADTVFFWDRDESRICGFDTTALSWTLCFTTDEQGPRGTSALVGDPINDRIVLIHSGRGGSSHEVCAVGLASGEWMELLGASD